MKSLVRMSIVTFIVTFAWALLGSQNAQAQWMFDVGKAVVKISSHFERDSELKLEGSGLLYIDEGYQLRVLTSEHVVIPDNQRAVHIIETQDGEKYEAEFLESSWSVGLAVLRVKIDSRSVSDSVFNRTYPSLQDIKDRGTSDYLTIQPWVNEPKVSQEMRLTALGVPAGTQRLKRNSAVTPLTVVPENEVLVGQRVLSAPGLPTEFGMSGGVVVSRSSGSYQNIIGILTHATYGTNVKAFIIPAYDAAEWAGSLRSDDFNRTYEDFQTQAFSQAQPEIVRFRNTGVRIEKRGGVFVVAVPNSFPILYSGTNKPTALQYLTTEMNQKRLRIVKLTGIRTSLSLHQLVGQLMSPSHTFFFEDFEGDQSPSEDGVREPPFLSPSERQTATYRFTETTWPLKKKWLDSNTMTWVHEKTIEEGRLDYTVSYLDKYGEAQIQRQTSWLNGKQPPSWNSQRVAELASTDAWRDRLANCTTNGGVMEVITVPAGRFKTCKVTTKGSHIWYGPTPIFGVVKIEDLDGSYTQELVGATY